MTLRTAKLGTNLGSTIYQVGGSEASHQTSWYLSFLACKMGRMSTGPVFWTRYECKDEVFSIHGAHTCVHGAVGTRLSPRPDTASAGPGMLSPGARTYIRTGALYLERQDSLPRETAPGGAALRPHGNGEGLCSQEDRPLASPYSRVHTGTLHPDSFGFTGPATKGREAATDVRRRQACSGGSGQAVWAVHVPLLLGGSRGGGHLL